MLAVLWADHLYLVHTQMEQDQIVEKIGSQGGVIK